MRYRKKPIVIEATQWFKNGDHPLDDCFRPFEDTGLVPVEPREGKIVRYFRHPDVSGKKVCTKCGHRMHEHGWIDGIIASGGHRWEVSAELELYTGHDVCPTDYIVTDLLGRFYPINSGDFESIYQPVENV